MTDVEGLFGWVDLTTTDVERAKEFYQDLFGWAVEPDIGPADTVSARFLLNGSVVSGITQLSDDMGAAGLGSAWISYVTVADADAVVARAEVASGAVVMAPAPVGDQGRLALVADPSGAVVGVWQPGHFHGAELFNVPGTLTWNELQSWDLPAAKQFYTDTFGWDWQVGAMAGYAVAMIDAKEGPDKSNCGAMGMPPGVPVETPSFWLAYFSVADCDATMAKAQELGGSVLFPAMDMEQGRFGGLVDPTGAAFAVANFGS